MIQVYEQHQENQVRSFLKEAFQEDGRIFDLDNKDRDLQYISRNYMQDGCFWCMMDDDDNKNIIGTIGVRKLSDCWEIRRWFVDKKYQGFGIGKKLLYTALYYAISHKITLIKAATLNKCLIAQRLFSNTGFVAIERYNNSSADIFYGLNITLKYKYDFLLSRIKQRFDDSLILNPTENIPVYTNNISFLKGLYVSERFKDLNDKIIFAGRDDYIRFFEEIKEDWGKVLSAYDVDLKTLSGLQAHMILFMCILRAGDTVMLLPEICGGHYSTETILKNIGAKIIHMVPDFKNLRVDQRQTEELIVQHNPRFIFVDRSEGLMYEDFSWLKKIPDSYKIFDASQYLSQILTGRYLNPFFMGFDMIISTLHKNYPGPQKGLICVKENSSVWADYQGNAKTYISGTHPESIAASILPLLDDSDFRLYEILNHDCSRRLEKELIARSVPVVKFPISTEPQTMHTWILCDTKQQSYNYYLKLEELGILTNYRLLPYNLGYGLRLGTGAAVRSGLTCDHVLPLAQIMAEIYFSEITPAIRTKAKQLIKQIKKSTEE